MKQSNYILKLGAVFAASIIIGLMITATAHAGNFSQYLAKRGAEIKVQKIDPAWKPAFTTPQTTTLPLSIDGTMPIPPASHNQLVHTVVPADFEGVLKPYQTRLVVQK